MTSRFSRLIVIVMLIALVVVAAPPAASMAETAPLDWSIPSGHFYTQANGYPAGTSPMGFAITDEGGILFWSEFQRLGGVDALGYPIGSRFRYQGFVCQPMQKGILQWVPTEGRVNLLNVFDILHDRGQDKWLAETKSTPGLLDPGFDSGKSWAEVVQTRIGLLEALPAIKSRYSSVSDPILIFGLPTSKVTDMGNHYSVRLQRAVIQLWKENVPWARAGETTVANGGDVAKEAGVFSAYTADPEDPPAGTWPIKGGQYAVEGTGTWYGPGFQGQPMANGEIYDMNDPTIGACNMYPLGSKIKVTSKNTGRSVIVTVKDTGAFRYPLIVDLSRAAFELIDNPANGVVPVILELITN